MAGTTDADWTRTGIQFADVFIGKWCRQTRDFITSARPKVWPDRRFRENFGERGVNEEVFTEWILGGVMNIW